MRWATTMVPAVLTATEMIKGTPAADSVGCHGPGTVSWKTVNNMLTPCKLTALMEMAMAACNSEVSHPDRLWGTPLREFPGFVPHNRMSATANRLSFSRVVPAIMPTSSGSGFIWTASSCEEVGNALESKGLHRFTCQSHEHVGSRRHLWHGFLSQFQCASITCEIQSPPEQVWETNFEGINLKRFHFTRQSLACRPDLLLG